MRWDMGKEIVRGIFRLFYATGLYSLLLRLTNALVTLTDYRSAFIMNIRPMWMSAGAAWSHCLPLDISFVSRDKGDAHGIVPRIIATFRDNVSDGGEIGIPGTAAIWVENLSARWGYLFKVLWANDVTATTRIFAGFFQEKFIWGMFYGNVVLRWPHRRPFLALNILGSLVEMGEGLGVARTENPEQGVPYWELDNKSDSLLSRVEAALGVPIGFPEISGAYGVRVGSRLLVQGQMAHIYAAWRILAHATRCYGPDRKLDIAEIGGGYGGLCFWLLRLGGERIASYTIIDLPSTNTAQAYFLAQALNSAEDIGLFSARTGTFDRQARIRLVPHMHVPEFHADIVVNQDSFPELPVAEVDRYLTWMTNHADYFLSINQEAYSPAAGIAQVSVPERCAQQPALRREVRERTWVRNGYVEEFYQVIN